MRVAASYIAYLFGILLFAAVSFDASAHEEAQLQSCNFPNTPEIQELGDARLKRIFTNVIMAFELDVDSFALCTNTTETMPGTAKKYANGKRVSVVMVPSFVLELSNDAAIGLFGHEIGHVVVGFRLYSMEYEIEVDLKAASKVGFEPMLVCHYEMNVLLAKHTPVQYAHNGMNGQTAERILALLAAMPKAWIP